MATAQHGVVAVWQLRRVGFSREWIYRQVTAKRLHRVYWGVYAVGHSRLSRNGWWMAAALAFGPAAVLSHRTAAALHNLLWVRDGATHVTVPGRGRRAPRGIVLHHVEAIPLEECGRIRGIPLTSVTRTLLDLARAKDPLLSYAIDEAADKELLDVTAIRAMDGRKGSPALREAIAAYVPTPHWTRSRLEKRFFRLMREHGIALPSVNQWVEGYEVDMLWPEAKLIVEIDSDLHDRPSARRRDPLRDAKLQLAGYKVYRVTEDALINRPDEVVQTVKDFLAR